VFLYFLINFNAVFKVEKCIRAANFGLGYLSMQVSLPIFAHWAVIDPSKISAFMQNSSKNHLF